MEASAYFSCQQCGRTGIRIYRILRKGRVDVLCEVCRRGFSTRVQFSQPFNKRRLIKKRIRLKGIIDRYSVVQWRQIQQATRAIQIKCMIDAGMSFRDAGDDIGVTRQRANQIYHDYYGREVTTKPLPRWVSPTLD